MRQIITARGKIIPCPNTLPHRKMPYPPIRRRGTNRRKAAIVAGTRAGRGIKKSVLLQNAARQVDARRFCFCYPAAAGKVSAWEFPGSNLSR